MKYSIFNWVIKDFYVNVNDRNIKIVPKDAYQKLTKVSLAYWIMDDGSFNKTKGTIILCTETPIQELMFYV